MASERAGFSNGVGLAERPGVPGVAALQGGVFTAEQARSEGWTPRMVRRRIASRRWVYVAGRALAQPSPQWTAFQLAMAAQLSLAGVVISHRTAAGLHGFPDPAPDEPTLDCDVTVKTRRPAGPRIRTHLLRLDESEVEPGPGDLWLTTAPRTALDCLATMPFGPALDLWAWVITRQILDLARLQAAIDRRKNWHGTPQLRRLAQLVAGGAVSQAEFRMHELLRAAGLTGWTPNAPIMQGKEQIAIADLLFAKARLIVEVDGWQAHSSKTSFVADRRRQNRLVNAGYTVLRFTWQDLINRPTHVVEEIRAALGLER